jgi:predicted Zn-dependent protease with MMP-like domain
VPYTIPATEFRQLVEEALDGLPDRFAKLVENVAVVIEDEPSDDDLDLIAEGHELLGVFRVTPPLPNQIAIFRGPILRVTHTREQTRRQVRDTVIHELGHYFGLGDHEMIY